MGKQSGVRSKFNFDTECRIQQNVVNIREGGRWTRGNNHQMLREQTKSVHPLIFVIHNNYVLQSNTLLDCLVVINVNSDICNCNCVFLRTQFIPYYLKTNSIQGVQKFSFSFFHALNGQSLESGFRTINIQLLSNSLIKSVDL